MTYLLYFPSHLQSFCVYFRSARSKVKGHLQLYHAYIPDPNEVSESTVATALPAATEPQSQDPEPGWEMVDSTDGGTSVGQAQVEQPARVNRISS